MEAMPVQLSDYAAPDWPDALIDTLHAAIASKLEQNPRLLGIAVHNLSIWRRRHPEQRNLIRRWKVIVYTWDFDDILGLLRDASADARRLRRESPFCGILTPEEIARACMDAGKRAQKPA